MKDSPEWPQSLFESVYGKADKKQLLDLMMRDDLPICRAWKQFRDSLGRIEALQRRADIFTIRQAELIELVAILKAYGVEEIKNEPTNTESR